MPIPKDEHGYLGRECPSPTCEGYFKLKPGTGLTGSDLPCHCPYCGHTASSQSFWTKEQLEYAKSVALRQVVDAFRTNLKRLEFDHKPRGPFGIGISMKVKPGPPMPIRFYRERQLETDVTCSTCTLEYAVYGVFAYCPDCGTHNSLQILQRNLALVEKQVALAESMEDVDFRRHLIEDGLENCVSAFDGFAREAVRALGQRTGGEIPSISFQNLERAASRLATLWQIDLKGAVSKDEWAVAHRGFMRRHVIAHRSGVVDDQYIAETGDDSVAIGRRLTITKSDVSHVAGIVDALGRGLIEQLSKH